MMLAFIQHILQSDSSRKRKRSTAFSTEHATSSEIEDLRQTIADNEPLASSEDHEKAISAFLALGHDGDLSPARKRRKQVGSQQNERLSTISEGQEEEIVRENRQGGYIGVRDKTTDGKEGMMDVDLQPQASPRSEKSNDRIVADQDLWTWKGGDILQR